MPITAFIGVRISWLIVARNELLASLAASAAARACCASLNRRTFSIAITAWSANVSSSATSFSLNAACRRAGTRRSSPAPRRPRAAAARRSPSGIRCFERHAAACAENCVDRRVAGRGCGSCAPRARRCPRRSIQSSGPGPGVHAACWPRRGARRRATRRIATTLSSNSARQLATIASNTGCVSVIEPLMHAQDAALSPSGAPAPRLRLVEQPHVLDRDHRLVGERLQQADLRRRERPHLVAKAARSRPRPRPRATAARSAPCGIRSAAGSRGCPGIRIR